MYEKRDLVEYTLQTGQSGLGRGITRLAQLGPRSREVCLLTPPLLLYAGVPPGKMLGMGTQIGPRLKQGIVVFQIEVV